MKTKKLITIITPVATLSATILPLCASATASYTNINELNQKNNSLTTNKRSSYDLIKTIKGFDGRIYQNVWAFDNQNAGKNVRAKTVPTNQFQGNKALQHISYQTSNDNEVTSIEKASFQGCSNLQSIGIPVGHIITEEANGNTVSTATSISIGERAFFRCSNLKVIDLSSYTSGDLLGGITVEKNAFAGTPSTGTILLSESVKEDTSNLAKLKKQMVDVGGLNVAWFDDSNIVYNTSPTYTKSYTVGSETKDYDMWDWTKVSAAADKIEPISDETTRQAKIIEISNNWTSGSATDYSTALTQLSSITAYVEVNSMPHQVRIIDRDHDSMSDGTTTAASGLAAFTFEFGNLISDSKGYSLATYWKNTSDTKNINSDFLNSELRKAIDGQGNGTANWFEKDSKTFSTTYTGSVLNMLPSDLKSSLKSVSKIVNEKTSGSWVETSYNTNLFLLTLNEFGKGSDLTEAEVTTYNYYINSATEVAEPKWIKSQVIGTTGARTEALTGSDLDGLYSGTKCNGAGYNSSTKNQGSWYWLSSPWPTISNSAVAILSSGYSNGTSLNQYALPIAPCFCI